MSKSLLKTDALFKINPLIREAILALKDAVDFELISLLMVEEYLSFSELKKKLGINPTELDRRLNRLMNGALVNNYYAKRKGRRGHSFYEATSLAKGIFVKLAEIEKPISPIPIAVNPFYMPGPEIDSLHRDLRSALDTVERFRHLTATEVVP